MEIRYVSNPDNNGWVLAVPDGVSPLDVRANSGKGISLPWCLKVELLQTQDNREYFKILEGVRTGEKASIRRQSATESFLTKQSPHRAAGVVKLKKSAQQLWFGNKGPFSAFTESTNPVPTGEFDLEIPDAPHKNYYPAYSKYQEVWFRIGHTGDRYLHLGTISHGCATVRPFVPPKDDTRFVGRSNSELGMPATTQPFAKWDDLCDYLMRARKGDGKNVGTIKVID